MKCKSDIIGIADRIYLANTAAVFEAEYGAEAAQALMNIINYLVTCSCRKCVGLKEE